MQIELLDLVLQADERRTKRRFDTNSPAPIRDRNPWPRQPEDGPIPLFENFPNIRKAAKSLECRNRAIQDAWDDYDSIFYNVWREVSIEPTRFIDLDVGIEEPEDDAWPNLGAIFAEHLTKLKMKHFQSTGKKNETVGSLLTVRDKDDERRTTRRFDTNSPAPIRDRDPWPRQTEDGPIPLFENFPNTRKTAKSLECRNRAIQDSCDDYDNIFYNAWREVSIEPMRKKKGTVESLLTPIFVHCGVPLDDADMDDRILYMDAAHLTSAQWLKNDRDCIKFRPHPRLVQSPVAQPRRYTVQRTAGPQPHQPEEALPPFPPMPDMSTRPEEGFQRVVNDALTAIWARVSRCRCSRRQSVRASLPSAAGPSRQRIGSSSEETNDED
ncbi:hypothetical protein F2Q69_00041039 [Brassica cretica]|uniref:Uncharacterized protein n=1 Tax=Brassica cretica TaxID=69181 RepID=A0A8S9NHR5_BRACR|nr:hypothetical protein F2Q69_00041039 [Brassica cretica]